MSATHRLPAPEHPGCLDRDRELTFTIDGERLTGHPGDTLASALIAHGRLRVGDSIYRRRPRGILSAGVEEPNALIRAAEHYGVDLVALDADPASTPSAAARASKGTEHEDNEGAALVDGVKGKSQAGSAGKEKGGADGAEAGQVEEAEA